MAQLRSLAAFGRLALLLAPCALSFSAARAIPISMSPISSLNLGTLTPGDLSSVIPPGTSETAQNASFLVSGDPNTAYTIVLPSGSVSLVTGTGTPAETITLSSFSSFPSPGANGSLDAAGQQLLFVGATRAGIASNQVPGSYSGNFTIVVTY